MPLRPLVFYFAIQAKQSFFTSWLMPWRGLLYTRIVWTFQKLSHLGGMKIFARKGYKPEKGGLMNKLRGGLTLFYYFTVHAVQSHLEGKVMFPLLLFGSSVFWVSHARFSSNSLLYENLVSFAHFWSVLVVYKKCWLLYLT